MPKKFKLSFKLDVYRILLLLAFLLCTISAFSYYNQLGILDNSNEAIIKIESIHSGVQRISKLELENSIDDELINSINKLALELLPESEDSIYFTENSEVYNLMEKVINDWVKFKEEVTLYRENGERDNLFVVSENNYNESATTIASMNVYVGELRTVVNSLEKVLIGLIVLIGLLLVKILLDTHKELQQNKELSKEMYIDASTGIYNRAKCQEVMKFINPKDNPKEIAVIIFDLNDLKKTNDNLGHRAGDQLIYDFAQQVKNATDIFSYEVFVGRYGGDEFVAFFESADESDVKRYIEQVYILMAKFNDTEGKPYNLNCAAGYGITSEENKDLTVKELFDIADEDMYKNKIAMKEKKKQEMIAQGIEVIEEVDDRLT